MVDRHRFSPRVRVVDQVVTTRELAAALGVTDTSVHRFLNKYGIAHRRTMGSGILVDVVSAIECLPEPYRHRLLAWYDSFLTIDLEGFSS